MGRLLHFLTHGAPLARFARDSSAIIFFNPFVPGDFAEKRVLKLFKWFSGHCRAVVFTGRTLRGLLIQMQNISLQSSGMRRKQNFESFWV